MSDISIIGAAMEEGCTGRKGTALGPYAIRRALEQNEGQCWGSWRESLKIEDYGDFHTGRAVEAAVGMGQDESDFTITLGGDHSVLLYELRAVAKKHGPVTLIQFDAHHDCWKYPGGVKNHATVIRDCVKEKLVKEVYQYGVRVDPDGANLRQVHRGYEDYYPADPAYLTVDIDVCDPAFAPGTGTPVPGGWSSKELLDAVRDVLAYPGFVGMDIVEVNPLFDVHDNTSLLAHYIAMEAMQARHGLL